MFFLLATCVGFFFVFFFLFCDGNWLEDFCLVPPGCVCPHVAEFGNRLPSTPFTRAECEQKIVESYGNSKEPGRTSRSLAFAHKQSVDVSYVSHLRDKHSSKLAACQIKFDR